MAQLSGFDPLKFLNITNFKNEEKDKVSEHLLNNISQYLLIRISELLPEEDLKKTKDPKDLFDVAKAKIPDINNKMKLFLEDFKKEFYKNIKV